MITSLRLIVLSAALMAVPHAALGQGAFGSAPAAPQAPAQPTPPPSRNEPARPEPAPAPAVAPADLPPAADIFRRSVEAIGGEAAIRSHTSMRVRGSIASPGMPKPGSMEILMLAPNRFLTVIDMGQLGRMEQGFDGTVGWSRNPMMGAQLLKGATLDELRRQSDFYKELDPGKLWDKAVTRSQVEFAGRRCWEVEVEGDLGTGSLFYDCADGLARGMRLTVDTPLGKVPTETRMLEYKAFDGLKIASRTEISAMTATQTMTVDTVTFEPIEPSVFDLPADVKALVANGGKPVPGQGKPGAPPRGAGGGGQP
ncbi:MAG: hypothetical protein EBQ99_05955 [Planctomycetes bacterium]|nr:hypothetical protein [Planctomycetota bacterium]